MLPPFDPWLAVQVGADVLAAAQADAAGLAQRQAERLTELLHAACASPLYRPLLQGRDLARCPLDELPVMQRRRLMRHFDQWVTDPDLQWPALQRFAADPARIADPFLGRYLVWESSGSHGEPGLFVQDARALAVYDALEALRRPPLRPLQRWLDPGWLGERIAFVGATSGHFASTVSVERLRRLNPALAPHLHSLSFLQPLPALVAALQAVAPTVLATYPSAALLLAEERLAGRLAIAPREIWTGGETLSEPMRRHIEQAFDCPLANSYGASEFLPLAASCRLGHLHLNSDWVILEPVDERHRPVPPGRIGATTLLTNLANHVQPLIRYDLGDRVTFSAQACACGSALPAIDVQGRCDDTLRLAPPGRPAVVLLPLALVTVLESEAGLFDFQLVQQGPAELLLCSPASGAAGTRALRRARDALLAFLAQQGAAPVQVRCQAGQPRRCGRSGKIQRVVARPTEAGRVRQSPGGA